MADVASLGIRVDATEAERARETLDRLAGQGAETERSLHLMARRTALALAGMVAGLLAVAAAGQRATQDLARFAAISNASTEQFQRMAAGVTLFGGSSEGLADQLKDVNDRIGDFLTTGGGPLADLFDQIAPRVGVTADAFRDLSGPDALLLFVSTLERAGVSQQEMVYQLEGLASDLSHLYPLLRDNGALLRVLADEAARAGAVIGDEAVDASNDLAAVQWQLEQRVKGLGNRLTEVLTPAMTEAGSVLVGLADDFDVANRAAATLYATLHTGRNVVLGATAAFDLTGKAIGGWAAVAGAAIAGEAGDAARVMDTANADLLATIDKWAGRMGAEIGQSGLPEQTGLISQALAEQRRLLGGGSGRGLAADTKLVSELSAELGNAALSARELAVATALAKLSPTATPEQRAEVERLAGAIYDTASAQDAQREAARSATSAQQESARAAETAQREAARASAQNADTVGALQEQLAQAALPARELAQRQAELRLNEYATPEQVAQVRELAGALADAQARAEAGRAFERIAGGLRAPAETGELASITASYDERRAVLQTALDTEYLTAQQHAEAMVLLEQQTAERRAAVTQQLAEQQQQAALQGMASAVSITQQQIGVMSGLYAEGSAAGRAFFTLSQSLAAANAVIQGIQASMAIRVAYAQMAAMAGPAAPAVLAAGETHAQVVQGLGFASAGIIMGQAIASFDGGGYTGDGPRMGGIDGRGGRLAVLHPQETVVDHTRGQRLGGTVNQTINIAGRVDNRTAQQLARASAREQRIAEARR